MHSSVNTRALIGYSSQTGPLTSVSSLLRRSFIRPKYEIRTQLEDVSRILIQCERGFFFVFIVATFASIFLAKDALSFSSNKLLSNFSTNQKKSLLSHHIVIKHKSRVYCHIFFRKYTRLFIYIYIYSPTAALKRLTFSQSSNPDFL